MDNYLYNLIRLTEPAVYAFVNEVDGYAYVSQSVNPMRAIGAILEDIANNRNTKYKGLIRDKDKLKLEIIKSSSDLNKRKMDVDSYVKLLSQRGIKLYNRYTGIKYRLMNRVVKWKVHLYLVNRRNDEKLIGVFDNFKDMEEFSTLYYSDLSSFYEVCALNRATKVWYSREKNQRKNFE